MRLRHLTLPAALLLLTACATFPEVDNAEARYSGSGTTPDLAPMEDILAAAGTPLTDEASRDSLLGRADGLRARADRLRSTRQD